MSDPGYTLSLLPDRLAVARLAPDAAVPAAPDAGGFWCAARTSAELSLIVGERHAPAGVPTEPGWRCLAVQGPFELGTVGVLAALAGPLADAGVSVLAVSTYDTDYLLVRDADLSFAVEALRAAGHAVDTRAEAAT